MTDIKQSVPLISIVSPVYKAEGIVNELIKRLEKSLENITDNYEIILIDDGSPDNAWSKIVENCKKNSRVKGIKLSRNFGQHHAITAGLDYSKGNWIVVMDCDLQDRPEEIPNLYNKAIEGYDLVFARRARRKDNFNKKLYSFIFYRFFSYLSDVQQDNTRGNFGIYSRKVIDSMNKLREPMRAFLPMAQWVGFKSTAVDVYHDNRFEGKTSYNWPKLINLALNISLAYSDKPLRLVINMGLVLSASAVLFSIYIISKYLRGEVHSTGYTSLIVSIWFLTGLIIFTLGIIALYIGKIFDSVKNRPLYLIDKITE